MYKRILSLGVAGALALHLSGCGAVNTQNQPPVARGTNPAALSEMQNAKVGALAVADWRKGFKTGDFSDLTAMLDDNVEFCLGTPLMINETSTTFAFNASGTLAEKLISANC